jgi:hypothetical protein
MDQVTERCDIRGGQAIARADGQIQIEIGSASLDASPLLTPRPGRCRDRWA